MPKYIIERDIPAVGQLPAQELQQISQQSCAILNSMGPRIQWLESYVTADKLYCVYIAPDAETIKTHAEQGGFPANRIEEINTIIDPTSAE